jgi:heptosyltransferase-1
LNILIVKLSAIGDVIHTLPSLTALRRCYPESDITWVVEETAADLLADHPDLDRVIVSGRKRWIDELKRGRIAGPLKEMLSFFRELRSRRYDLVVDFHGLFKSAVIVLLSGGKRKLGYDSLQELSGLFYNEKIPEDMGKHAVDRYLDFVRHIAGKSGEHCIPPVPEFKIALGEKEKQRVAALLDEHTEMWPQDKSGPRFIAVNPVAFWETKLWRDERFAELCDRIREELGIGVVLTGGEAAPLERIAQKIRTPAVNFGGRTTLRELACLYRQAALLVTTDSGPMHLAAAVGTPVVALFGPTDPSRTGPCGDGHRVVRTGISCSPCFRKRCGNPRCMTEMTVAEVLAAVKETMRRAI